MGPLPLNLVTTPITVFALSLWTFSRWATIAHHACHGGYNNCRSADPSGAFHSRSFAVGSLRKRATQWFDWMLPEAWSVEHNNLHHYRLGEEGDPDNVQRNLAFVRTMTAPKAVKYAGVAFLMTSWKWFYYAPNTYKELVIARMRRRGEALPDGLEPRKEFTLKDLFLRDSAAAVTVVAGDGAGGAGSASGGGVRRVRWYTFADFFRTVMGPYMIGHFLAIPACLLLVGAMVHGGGGLGLNWAAGWVWFQRGVANLVLADVLTNIHAFVAIMPNHCGDDLYAFADRSVKPNSASFYLRQVVSSANFRTVRSGGRGSDLNDFMHGWLNYGIEHHVRMEKIVAQRRAMSGLEFKSPVSRAHFPSRFSSLSGLRQLFPNLSALSARRCHAEVKECCERHGVPYVQETVLKRLRKTIAVMVGDASMREFPPEWEPPADRMVWGDQLPAGAAAETTHQEVAVAEESTRPQQKGPTPTGGRLSLAG